MLEGLIAGEGDVVQAEAEVRAAPRQPLSHQRYVLDAAVTEGGHSTIIIKYQLSKSRTLGCVIPRPSFTQP